jgi:hypothetical protein
MADYYSLLSRAITALPQSNPETRLAVFDRARKALVKQLTSIEPPIPEEAISKEKDALEEAIQRLEIDLATRALPQSAPPPPPRPSAPPALNKPTSALAPSFERFRKKLTETTKTRFVTPPKIVKAVQKPLAQKLQSITSETGLDDPTQREPQRPAAPARLPPKPSRTKGQIYAVIGVLIALILVLTVLAWKLHESPDDLAKLNPQSNAGRNPNAETGKLGDRIEGGGLSRGSATVPTVQKAEMWVGSLKEPDKVDRIYNATVQWRLENVGGSSGEPVTPAIRGEVDIPEAKLKMSILIRKNADPTLSASHTINISFAPTSDSPLGGVKAIGPLQLRRPDAQAGEKIVGIPVPISENYFLIGLMRGERENRNIALLRSQAIIDLPFQFDDGRIATINMEKGASGDRVFSEAIESWNR